MKKVKYLSYLLLFVLIFCFCTGCKNKNGTDQEDASDTLTGGISIPFRADYFKTPTTKDVDIDTKAKYSVGCVNDQGTIDTFVEENKTKYDFSIKNSNDKSFNDSIKEMKEKPIADKSFIIISAHYPKGDPEPKVIAVRTENKNMTVTLQQPSSINDYNNPETWHIIVEVPREITVDGMTFKYDFR